MRRWLVSAANVLFGVVPATYLFLWVVFFMVAGLGGMLAEWVGLMDDIDATIDPWKVTLFFLAGTAAVSGYVALLSAVKGVRTPRVVVGLGLGIAANVYAIPLILDLNPNALQGWFEWYWVGSPIVVALAHVVTYFVGARRDRLQKHAGSGAS